MKSIPIYKMIERDLRRKILDGKLIQGDLVPSENELASTYKVSRMTVRQAINNLVLDKYIRRHKGLGTFVTYNLRDMDTQKKSSFSFTIETRGVDTPITRRVLVFIESMADEDIAKRLQLKVGDPIIYIECLHQHRLVPVAYEYMYLPKNMYSNLQKETFENSFYEYIQTELNWRIRNSDRAIEVRELDKRTAEMLHQKEGDPSLYMNSVTYLDNGRAFEYTRCYYLAEHFRFTHDFKR